MASDCIGFEVRIDNDDGTSLPLEAMQMFAVTNGLLLISPVGLMGLAKRDLLKRLIESTPLLTRNLTLSAISISSEGPLSSSELLISQGSWAQG